MSTSTYFVTFAVTLILAVFPVSRWQRRNKENLFRDFIQYATSDQFDLKDGESAETSFLRISQGLQNHKAATKFGWDVDQWRDVLMDIVPHMHIGRAYDTHSIEASSIPVLAHGFAYLMRVRPQNELGFATGIMSLVNFAGISAQGRYSDFAMRGAFYVHDEFSRHYMHSNDSERKRMLDSYKKALSLVFTRDVVNETTNGFRAFLLQTTQS